ncbi:MAG: ATP-dependent Zn protease [Oscillospiraceae bacterium]|nr:ATP-dependent Zn protease [Oscillospiraceae bacterium]
MKTISRINIYAITTDVIRCFITSCGITLLIIFFNKESIPLSKEIVRNCVLSIFSMQIPILFVINILFNKRRWVQDDNDIHNDNPIGKAVIASDSQKTLYAVHEAGHAVMAYLQEMKDYEVQMSCIPPQTITTCEFYTADDVKKRILIKYSGAVAEELILGNFSCGSMGSSESDFPSAVDWIKAYIVMTDPTVSKTLLNEELSAKIIAVSKNFYQEAKDILSKNKEMLVIISDELKNKDTLNKNEIIQLLKDVKSEKG